MKFILLCVWAERAILGSSKTAFKLNLGIVVLLLSLCVHSKHFELFSVHLSLCYWAEPAVLGSAKTALEFKYEI